MRLDVPIGDPRFGLAQACSCGIAFRRQIAALDDALHYTAEMQTERLSDHDRVDGHEAAYNAVRDYIEQPCGWLYLYGPFGDGKTTLLMAAINGLRAAGYLAVLAVVPELLDWLRAAFEPANARSFDGDFNMVKNIPVLGLDDLGKEKPSPWVDEKLYELLNWRYRQHLPTIITANCHPKDLAQPALTSRFGDVMLCKTVFAGNKDLRTYRGRRPVR
ncbi:hypothetical protein [Devosia sp.]|uniref:hypothetical protein n=1 Tax=Devosia sp. TaxID=1871048 RepID=UPI002736207E|nr:hypothetical protein [Devosia sp.]MDP2779762.1 hypothetical protein [Devosia sp.]